MKRKLLGFLPVICALVCTSTVYGQSMSLGDATGEFGTVVDVSPVSYTHLTLPTKA